MQRIDTVKSVDMEDALVGMDKGREDHEIFHWKRRSMNVGAREAKHSSGDRGRSQQSSFEECS
jgi:hypothetical protein